MPELRAAFESAGFTDVRTVLTSGNVVFSARAARSSVLERRAEAAMAERLGRSFLTIVRPVEALRALLGTDPYGEFRLPEGSRRVVSFLRNPPPALPLLPIELRGARILRVEGREVFTTYLPDPKGPDFMMLIERTFGREVTTRTWETVSKVVR